MISSSAKCISFPNKTTKASKQERNRLSHKIHIHLQSSKKPKHKFHIKENLYRACFRQNSPHTKRSQMENSQAKKKTTDVACQPHQHAGAQPLQRLNKIELVYCTYTAVFFKPWSVCLCARRNVAGTISTDRLLAHSQGERGCVLSGFDVTYAKKCWKILVCCLCNTLKPNS